MTRITDDWFCSFAYVLVGTNQYCTVFEYELNKRVCERVTRTTSITIILLSAAQVEEEY